MADEKSDESKESPPKPVRKVKKTLSEGTAPGPVSEKEGPKPATEALQKETPGRKEPETAKPAAKKPTPRAAAEKPAAKPSEKKPKPKAPATKPPTKEEPEKKEKAPPKKEKAGEKKKPGKKAEKKKEEEEAEEEEHEARKKPEMTDAIRVALRLRREFARRRPRFYRQEWFRHPRLGLKWRKPQGGQSKLRRHLGWRINVVSIGFRGPKTARGLHPSGFREVLVRNAAELKGVDPKISAIRIAGGVGGRKRQKIMEEADELGLRVLNRREE